MKNIVTVIMLILFAAFWFEIGQRYNAQTIDSKIKAAYQKGYNHKQLDDLPSPGYQPHKTSTKYQKARG